MVMCYTPVKVPLLLCSCTHLLRFPLSRKLNYRLGDVSQVWYADDASVAGKIEVNGEVNLAISPMPPKLGWSQRKNILPLLQPFLPTQVSK